MVGKSPPYAYCWLDVVYCAAYNQNSTANKAYEKSCIRAYDLKDPNRRSQLWKTTVKSEGKSSDLRIVLAYMIAGAVPYFGTDTGKQIDVTIRGHDQRVLDIWK
jgi:hypothetical protein